MRSIVLSVSLNRTGTSHGIRRTGSPVERTEGEIPNQLESSFRGVKNRSKVSDRRYNVGCWYIASWNLVSFCFIFLLPAALSAVITIRNLKRYEPLPFSFHRVLLTMCYQRKCYLWMELTCSAKKQKHKKVGSVGEIKSDERNILRCFICHFNRNSIQFNSLLYSH